MSNKFQGKRAEIGVYDDAMDQEYKKAHGGMLARNSFDTGINIFDDGSCIVSGYISEDTIDIKIDNNLSKDQLKIIEGKIIEILRDKY